MRYALFLIISFFLIISASFKLSAFNQSYAQAKYASVIPQDAFYQYIGELRSYFSYMSFQNADIYMHGGLHEQALACRALHNEAADLHNHDDHDQDCVNGDHKPGCIHNDRDTGAITAPRRDILHKIAEAVALSKHMHLEGAGEKELLPWFYFATVLDPNNIIAYSTGGHWLGVRLGKVDESIAYLKTGIKNNPEAFELYKTLGEIYLLKARDPKEAISYLEMARKLASAENIDRYEIKEINIFLSEAYGQLKMYDKCVPLYEEILQNFPEDSHVKQKIADLKALVSPV